MATSHHGWEHNRICKKCKSLVQNNPLLLPAAADGSTGSHVERVWRMNKHNDLHRHYLWQPSSWPAILAEEGTAYKSQIALCNAAASKLNGMRKWYDNTPYHPAITGNKQHALRLGANRHEYCKPPSLQQRGRERPWALTGLILCCIAHSSAGVLL